MRRLVIGDIHGRLDALERILELAAYDPASDKIYCVGDYIDTGGESYEVVEYLLALEAKAHHKPVFIMGNHDLYFLKIFSHPLADVRNEKFIRARYDDWMDEWEGSVTYHSYMKQSDADINRHLNTFYKKLKYYHVEEGLLFVHAGYDPELGLRKNVELNGEADLTWSRKLYLAAYDLWQNAKVDEDDIFDGFSKIYIGHTPTIKQGLELPTPMGKLINVDQGCKVDGRLSLWVDGTGEYFQVGIEKNGIQIIS